MPQISVADVQPMCPAASLGAGLAGPRHLAIYARNHWAIENREHYGI